MTWQDLTDGRLSAGEFTKATTYEAMRDNPEQFGSDIGTPPKAPIDTTFRSKKKMPGDLIGAPPVPGYSGGSQTFGKGRSGYCYARIPSIVNIANNQILSGGLPNRERNIDYNPNTGEYFFNGGVKEYNEEWFGDLMIVISGWAEVTASAEARQPLIYGEVFRPAFGTSWDRLSTDGTFLYESQNGRASFFEVILQRNMAFNYTGTQNPNIGFRFKVGYANNIAGDNINLLDININMHT